MLALMLTCSGGLPAGAQPQQQRSQAAQEALPEITILYQREGEPYRVGSTQENGIDQCFMVMADRTTQTLITLQMDGSSVVTLSIETANPVVMPSMRELGRSLPLTIEVDGIEQVHRVITVAPPPTNASGAAEGKFGRAAQRHMQSAVNSRTGFTLTLPPAEPIRLTVPPKAAEAFSDCIQAGMQQRMQQDIDRMRRSRGNQGR